MALRPIFGVYVKETVYEGGGRFLETWWKQAAAEQHLKVTREKITGRIWCQGEIGLRVEG